MRTSAKDVLIGFAFVASGSVFAIGAWRTLELGSVIKLGPGVFPLGGSLLLIFLGLLTAIGVGSSSKTPAASPPWRALIVLTLAPVLFALSVRGLGLALALAISVFIASYASRTITFALAFAITAILALFSIAVFSFGLGLPYPLVGTWLTD